MTQSSLVVVPDELYKSAKEYIPAHWFNILFAKPHSNKSDASNHHRYHRLILLNEVNLSKAVDDSRDLYDNSVIVVVGSMLLLTMVTLTIVGVVSSYLSVLEFIMACVIIVTTMSHMYSRSELLRVKKEHTVHLIKQLSTY